MEVAAGRELDLGIANLGQPFFEADQLDEREAGFRVDEDVDVARRRGFIACRRAIKKPDYP